ncbi:1-phosphofructokinase family hexose kinase [Paenibacillus antri]|uniref:Tagatose-6-phosphate kinase n=1 Tax=Paenibacillus antri TaxID=2582848 RepID=A0A5R9G5G8_9BACL|nr:1-phosphofructokinase family hexose kinase [Paenibacillus antri]TLS50289.1 1-phosphofructokinase family hexose kinase [Paenibacillus antri]
MKGIATVTMNAAIDKTYRVPSLPLGRVTRIPEMVAYPGGKGINVARALRQLGCDVVATGFVAGFNGAYIRTALSDQGVAHDFVDVAGESRLCLNVLHDGGASTELLEPGPSATEADFAALERKVAALAERSAIVCLSGSAPTGVPANAYERLVGIVRKAGALAFLDASGALLAGGVRAAPDFVKPNEHEVAALSSQPATDEAALAACARELVGARGIGCAAITLGAAGALVGCGDAVYRVRVPALRVVSAVGCGDAFVAGMAAGTLRGDPLEQRIRLAAAAACANALHREAGRIDPAELERLLPMIDITQVE